MKESRSSLRTGTPGPSSCTPARFPTRTWQYWTNKFGSLWLLRNVLTCEHQNCRFLVRVFVEVHAPLRKYDIFSWFGFFLFFDGFPDLLNLKGFQIISRWIKVRKPVFLFLPDFVKYFCSIFFSICWLFIFCWVANCCTMFSLNAPFSNSFEDPIKLFVEYTSKISWCVSGMIIMSLIEHTSKSSIVCGRLALACTFPSSISTFSGCVAFSWTRFWVPGPFLSFPRSSTPVSVSRRWAFSWLIYFSRSCWIMIWFIWLRRSSKSFSFSFLSWLARLIFWVK